jgi:hydroxyethylthiazole kinase-like uncharacterized protein yjeF
MPRRKTAREALRLTAAQCRAVDRYAIEVLGVPGLVLMENAGRNAADLIEKWARRKRAASPVFSIVCGRGNNGGDGFVIARQLALRGFEVSVDLLGESGGLSPDAAVNCAIVRKMGVPVWAIDEPERLARAVRRWRRSAVLVDALLGTGFAGEVREPLAGVIRRINALRGPLVVAVDVPSGLNADTGKPGGVAIKADYTVTFLAEKIGFARPAARAYVGRVTVVDIGAPLQLALSEQGRQAGTPGQPPASRR